LRFFHDLLDGEEGTMLLNKMNALGFSFLLIFASLVGCSQQTSLRACGSAGYFADKNTCEGGSASNPCVMTTVSSSSGSGTVCWKMSASTSSNQTTTLGGGCESSPWAMGEWSACGGSVTTQTRTVDCKPGCTCSASSKPVTTQACPTMLFNSVHSATDCQQQPGSSLITMNSKYYCGIQASECPAGWIAPKVNNLSYTITQPVFENGFGVYGASVWCQYYPISSGYHPSFQAMRDQKTICSEISIVNGSYCNCKTWKTIESTVSKILCY
jgi:hypothetical protein